jgi:hypothetical protein
MKVPTNQENRAPDTDAVAARPSRPAFVPRTTGRRQETARAARASNQQVRNQIRVSSLGEIGPGNTLKVETRVQIALGLLRSEAVSSVVVPMSPAGPSLGRRSSLHRERHDILE